MFVLMVVGVLLLVSSLFVCVLYVVVCLFVWGVLVFYVARLLGCVFSRSVACAFFVIVGCVVLVGALVCLSVFADMCLFVGLVVCQSLLTCLFVNALVCVIERLFVPLLV